MIIDEIKINNYKSLEEKNNILKVNPAVTILIGKNESGKSNVLNAVKELSLIRIQKNQETLVGKFKNRKASNPISIAIKAFFTSDESNITDVTQFIFKETGVTYEGGLTDYFAKNEIIKQGIIFFESKAQNMGYSAKTTIMEIIGKLKTLGSKADSQLIERIKTLPNSFATTEQPEINKYVKELLDEIQKFLSLFPSFYLYKDETLLDKYSIDEVKNEAVPTKKLGKLFNYLGVTQADLIAAMQDGTDPTISTKRREIVKKFNTQIGEAFTKYYKQETISVTLHFERGVLYFEVDSNNIIFKFSERSNGLRWYFNLFVSLLAEGVIDKKIVLMIDEPGVYLHVNAQEELMKFFEHLSGENKQVIFTTHSPFMIDTENLNRLRLIEKVDGFTKIHNKQYNDLNETSKRETLSPLLKAIGAKFSNLSPDLTRLNIVTEGITDYYYIKAMMYSYGIKGKIAPFIIPCIGVSEENAVASILMGWGCRFMCVIDYDTAGYNEYSRLKKLGLVERDDIITVNTKPIDKIDMQANSEDIESLISAEDKAKLPTGDKTLTAKSFHDSVINGTITPTQKTKENFKRLFIALKICDAVDAKTKSIQRTQKTK